MKNPTGVGLIQLRLRFQGSPLEDAGIGCVGVADAETQISSRRFATFCAASHRRGPNASR